MYSQDYIDGQNNGLIVGMTMGLNGGNGLPPPYAVPGSVQQVSSISITVYNNKLYPGRKLYLTAVNKLAESTSAALNDGDTFMVNEDCWLFLWYQDSGQPSQFFVARYLVGISWDDVINFRDYQHSFDLSEAWSIANDIREQITWSESISGVSSMGGEH